MSRHRQSQPVNFGTLLRVVAAIIVSVTVIVAGVLGAVAAWGFHPLFPLGWKGALGAWLIATSFLLFALYLTLRHLGGKP